MKNETNKTAVEWLVGELLSKGIINFDGWVWDDNISIVEIIEQAREIEKEQMRLADKNGQDRNQYKHDCKYGGVEYWDNEPKSFEEYYNETFNTKEK